MTTVLISGAGIAGPALAHWLARSGHAVTVVERAPALRADGYPVDLRGVAVEAVARMGLLPQVEAARTGTRRVTFAGADGRVVGVVEPEAFEGPRAVELPRGDLTRLLYEHTREHVEYVFGDTVTGLVEGPGGVEVTFEHAAPRTVGLVVGADGVHSAVRALAFGPEEPFRHDLGHRYAGFGVPDRFGLDREVVLCNVPGRLAAVYAVGERPGALVLFAFADRGAGPGYRDVTAQRRLVADTFAGDGWLVPQLLARMAEAGDFYSDTVSQIRMPAWTRGRVALLGDAAHAPSFLSGQGTSLAVVGAYVLAAHLTDTADHTVAFAAYERTMRPFVERNQRLAGTGGRAIVPSTRGQLLVRNALVRAMPLLARLGVVDRATSAAASALRLPDPAAAPG